MLAAIAATASLVHLAAGLAAAPALSAARSCLPAVALSFRF